MKSDSKRIVLILIIIAVVILIISIASNWGDVGQGFQDGLHSK